MWDVLVVGGGTAGAVAGIAAARRGARTLIVEAGGSLGGTATGGLVTPMMANSVAGVPLVGGISAEIQSRLAATDDAAGPAGDPRWSNPEMLKSVLDDLTGEAGCEVLFHTVFESAIVSEGAVAGAAVVNKAGRSEIAAARVIDATGDADVAASAGCPVACGGPNGERQSVSLRFTAANVDITRFCQWIDARGGHGFRPPIVHYMSVWGRGEPLEPVLEQAVKDGALLREDGDFFQMFSVPGRPGEMAFNCPRLPGVRDATDPWELSRVQVEGRRSARRLMAFCRRYLPGFEGAYVGQIAAMPGVRESRRIVGEYTLTGADCAAGRKFADAVARCNYPVDIHDPEQPGGVFRASVPEGDWYEVPYRCLVPLGVENLLVAGRCLSADFEAQASVRIQPPMRATGEAAGLAAAMSAQRGVSPRALDGRLVREAMDVASGG